MEGMISVWMDIAEYKDYMKGKVAIGWSMQERDQKINLVVPLTHVTGVEDWGKEGIEINIQQPQEGGLVNGI